MDCHPAGPAAPSSNNSTATRPSANGDRVDTSRSVVYLWDAKAQQVVCALRSRLAASGLTSLPRQCATPDVATIRPNLMGLAQPSSPIEHQDFMNLMHALQQPTNVLDLPEVCHDFFERTGCAIANVTAYGNGNGQHKDRIGRRTTGSKCHRAHVIGVDHTWRIVLPTVNQAPNCPPRYEAGFVVQCYNNTRTQYYKIPSSLIAVTNGSEAFVDRYNKEGRHFHGEPFIACPEFAMSCLAPISCPHGSQCPNIHIVLPTNPQMLQQSLGDLASVEQQDHVRRDANYLMREVDQSLRMVQCPQSAFASAHRVLDVVFGGTPSHIATDDARTPYPRIGRSFVVRVYAPNFSADAETDYASEQVLVTAGSLRYRNQMLSQRADVALTASAIEFYMGGTNVPTDGSAHFPILYPHPTIQKIQHCAHFKNKGICRNGQSCKFIHIIEAAPPAMVAAPHPQHVAQLPQFHSVPVAPPMHHYAPQPQQLGALRVNNGMGEGVLLNPHTHDQQPYAPQAQQHQPMHPQQVPHAFPQHGNTNQFHADQSMPLGHGSQRVVVRTRNPQRPF